MLARLLTAAALAMLMAPWAAATTSRASAPVGFMRYELSHGLQTIGFPLVHEAVVAGRVESTDATSLYTTDDIVVATHLDPARAYYLEITAGPDGMETFVGDRLELDVTRTTDTANHPQRIRLQLGSSYSTLRALPEELVGYRFVIRPHLTLADAFGTGLASVLQAGYDTATADQAYLLQNGSYQSYLFQTHAVTGEHQWVRFPEGNIADDLPIAPGAGLFVRHVGYDPVAWRHIGTVRTNAFVQPLRAGQSLVAEPFPVESSFATRGMTTLNGFTPGPDAGAADIVSQWNGETYRTHFFAEVPGSDPSWRGVDNTAQSATSASSDVFSPFRAVVVEKLAADPDYVVPSPLL